MDAMTFPWLAGHGYACLRVDARGTGDSCGGGALGDEYTGRQLRDLSAVVAWAAAQPWCDGDVFLMGCSWGGIVALALAAWCTGAGPHTKHLRGVIAVCATDDSYSDDMHAKSGVPLLEVGRSVEPRVIEYRVGVTDGSRRRRCVVGLVSVASAGVDWVDR